MAVLDNTIVNVALPQMAHAFKTDFQTIEWVVTGYFLAQAAVIPVTGYLSDRIGTKITFITALVLFTGGSALCAFAPSKEMLIAFRVLQGVGGGALFPMAFAIVFRVFPPAERGPASAIIGVPVLLAPAFGPTIGGYLTQTFDWSAIFTVNIPIGIIAVILAAVVLRGRAADHAVLAGEHGEEPASGQRFDVLGLLLAMSGFTALVYGITEAGAHGWNDTVFDRYHLGGLTIDVSVARFLIVGGVLLLLLVINELVVKDPVIDIRLFLNYTFSISNVLLWAITGLLFGSLILIPVFFETIRQPNYGPLETGQILISQGLAAAITTVFAGQLYNRIGPRIMVAVGFALLAIGSIGFTLLDLHTSGWSVQGWLVVRGLGLGLTNIPLQTLVVSAVSNRAMARASSLVNVTRQVAGAIGVAALTTYLTQQTKSQVAAITTAFQGAPLAQAKALCFAQNGPNVPAIQTCVAHAAQHYVTSRVPGAIVTSLNQTFMITVIGCAACVLLALIVGRDPAVEAAKRAAARGDQAEAPRVVVGE
jgi:EmrB/QacA subfamily drug resistance transporter